MMPGDPRGQGTHKDKGIHEPKGPMMPGDPQGQGTHKITKAGRPLEEGFADRIPRVCALGS